MNCFCFAFAVPSSLKNSAKGDLDARLAAMVSTGSIEQKRTPKIIILAILTSTGSLAKCRPRGVSLSLSLSAATAPTWCNTSTAALTESIDGG